MNIILAILYIAALGRFDTTVVDAEVFGTSSNLSNAGGVGVGAIIILCATCIASATVAFTAFACLNLMPSCCACPCKMNCTDGAGGRIYDMLASLAVTFNLSFRS